MLILIIRPLVVLTCTWRTGLKKNERALIGWLAPRGIVAAAVALVGRRPLWNEATSARRRLAAVSCLLVLGLIGMGYESVLRSTGQ